MKRCFVLFDAITLPLGMLCMLSFGGNCRAQVPGVPVAETLHREAVASRFRIDTSTIDTQTRWGFRSLANVTVSSSIVRLGDVVVPLDPNMPGWTRMKRSVIGLVPLDGEPMTIVRERLQRVIYNAEATPSLIDWIGPKKTKVVYHASTKSEQELRSSSVGSSSVGSGATTRMIQQTAYANPVPSDTPPAVTPPAVTPPAATPPDVALSAVASSKSTPAPRPLTTAQASRVTRWIVQALNRQHPSIADVYEIDKDRLQLSGSIGSIGGIDSIEPSEEVHEGKCRFHLVCRSFDGAVEVDIDLMLKTLPQVVVPRKNFPRGHRLALHDLVLQSLPSEDVEQDHVMDPEEIVGLEVRGTLRAERPIVRSDLGQPILIRRGDLIEIRVVGGGITVSTNAKSRGEGAESDLVEVETLETRKRLVARVVGPGLVEIVTRAPRVRR